MKLKDIRSGSKTLRKVTLVFLVNNDKVLLAMKKRGFGKDRWNGVGGKLKENETVREAATREAKEEIGVGIKKLQKVATLDFYFAPNRDWDQKVIVFLVNDWNGEPVETEEMAPKWFDIQKLPYKKMWIDDIYWLPLVLKGQKIKGEFLFGENDSLLDYKVRGEKRK